VDQLRDDIDRGRTGDKVEGSDPAAVPLGTDEEAAGTPLSQAAVAQARAEELASAPHPPQHQAGLGAAWILVTFASVLLVGLVTWEVIRMW
jgi:hypothetical protein